MDENVAVKLTEIESRCRSNSHRIQMLEQTQEELHRIATSVEVMVSEQRRLRQDMQELDRKVGVLERRPASRWDAVVDKILLVTVSAVVSFLLLQLGISG